MTAGITRPNCYWIGAQFVSVCSWTPGTSLKTCSNFVGAIKENERTKEK